MQIRTVGIGHQNVDTKMLGDKDTAALFHVAKCLDNLQEFNPNREAFQFFCR